MSVINEIGQVYQRPWGTYKTLEISDGIQVKLIDVNPGGRLSLQSHEHRSEHWVVVKGTATIRINDDIQDFAENEHAFIPKHAKHRLENNTETMVRLVEVQMGSYLGEDDITRYEDAYGR